jgi:acyl carrier protein
MKSPQDLQEKVLQLVATSAQIALTEDQLDQDLHLDSMALLELLVGLEKEFGIQVDEAELDPLKDFRSVESISAFVFGSLQAGGAS